ncbi:hypothetical protein BO79DRAFT_266131 [Aspergillus costaricaensis CBS 115574]|uniref:Uncharacterized protein n=1 Tax=Aspergillus costaricaensis CBS 115574 TaxID=1448317 RepID=A0ACD1IDP2_9EURO|nr:hypothetical protein BO79DRAFT_266131 [Aspergillus costaricaensis CBS 115574]RAK88717.1 hypothetical protein BO79DRAFT_266131 [Aspergillus costaricaensis CBS 115574]
MDPTDRRVLRGPTVTLTVSFFNLSLTPSQSNLSLSLSFFSFSPLLSSLFFSPYSCETLGSLSSIL